MMANEITLIKTNSTSPWYQPLTDSLDRLWRVVCAALQILVQSFAIFSFNSLTFPTEISYEQKPAAQEQEKPRKRPPPITVDSRYLTVPALTPPKKRPAPIQTPSEPAFEEEEFHTAKSSLSVYKTPPSSPANLPNPAPAISESDEIEALKMLVPQSVAPIFERIVFPITKKLSQEIIYNQDNHPKGVKFQAKTTGFKDTFKAEFGSSRPHISLELDKTVEWTQTVQKKALQIIHFTRGLKIVRELISPPKMNGWKPNLKYGTFWAKTAFIERQVPKLANLSVYANWKKDSSKPLRLEFDQLQLEEYEIGNRKREFSLSCKVTCTFNGQIETFEISSQKNPEIKQLLQGWTSDYILHALKNMKRVDVPSN